MTVDPLVLAESHRLAQVQGATSTQRLLDQAFVRHVDPYNLTGSIDRYTAAALPIVRTGFTRSTGLGLQYYSAARQAAGLPGIVPAGSAVPFDAVAAATSLRVTGPVTVATRLGKGDTFAQALASARLATAGYGKRATLAGGRSVVARASARDSESRGWARLSDGSPCSFCAMLVSRGPVYGEQTVAFRAHDRCGCGTRAVFSTDADGGWSDDALALRRLWARDPEWYPGKVWAKGDPLPHDANSFRSALSAQRKRAALSAPAETPAWRQEAAASLERAKAHEWASLGKRAATDAEIDAAFTRRAAAAEANAAKMDAAAKPSERLLAALRKHRAAGGSWDDLPSGMHGKLQREGITWRHVKRDADGNFLRDDVFDDVERQLTDRSRFYRDGATAQRAQIEADRIENLARYTAQTDDEIDALLTARRESAVRASTGFGSADEVAKAADDVEARLERVRALDRRIWDLPDGAPYPDDLRAALKAEGLPTRKALSAVSEDLRDTEAWLANLRRDVTAARDIEAHYAKAEIRESLRRKVHDRPLVDDLDDLGALGSATRAALDDVLDVGKHVDDEVTRRLTAAGVPPQPRPPSWGDIKDRFGDDAYSVYRARQAEVKAWQATHGAAYRQTVRDVLSDVRPLGTGGPKYVLDGAADTLSGAADLERAMASAHANYPDEWLDRLAARRPTTELGIEGRGYNRGGGERIALSRKSTDPDMLGVATHELGHSMEQSVPGLRAMEWALHYERSAKRVVDGKTVLDEPFDIYGGDIGMGQELAHRDTWAEDYTGKTYRGPNGAGVGADTSWEVFTTGVESLYEGSGYFIRAIDTDDEFRRFILGVLSVL